MICKGNLILRTMVPEYFNNSLYFKSYMRFFKLNSDFTQIKKRVLKMAIFFSFVGYVNSLTYFQSTTSSFKSAG